jgi:uncharacterized membrane protein YkvA (DUF1232 family)
LSRWHCGKNRLKVSQWVRSWKRRVGELKVETYAIYLAYRDPRVPWYAKVLIALVVAHAFSPIDLIPDFIPLLGYVDDLIIVPLGIALALKLIPGDVMAECRAEVRGVIDQDKRMGRTGAALIISIWLLIAGLAIAILLRAIRG